MKNLSHLLLAFTGIYLFLFSTGCPDDGSGDGTALPPEIVFESGAGIVDGNTDLPFGQAFTVRVRLDDGDAPLQSLTISKDGVNVPFSELTFDGGAITANNPLLITGGNTSGVTYDITITPANAEVGSNTYLFTVTDTENRFDSDGLTINYLSDPPTVVLEDDPGFISGDATLTTANQNFDVRVTIDDNGTNLLTSLTILEDGLALDPMNLVFDGIAESANPLGLISGEQMGATFDIQITPTSTTAGTRTYTFEAMDDRGQIGSTTILITFEESNIEMTLTGVLFNQGAAAGFGGLDLDTGTGTGSNNASAEIQDEGIDTDIEVANNWRRQISAANDAILREVNLAQLPDGFSFATVTTQQQIVQAYDTGDTPSGDDSNCNCTDTVDDEAVTDQVVVGDLYTVLRNGRYYLIEVTAVNVTTNNNQDNYELNIKY